MFVWLAVVETAFFLERATTTLALASCLPCVTTLSKIKRMGTPETTAVVNVLVRSCVEQFLAVSVYPPVGSLSLGGGGGVELSVECGGAGWLVAPPFCSAPPESSCAWMVRRHTVDQPFYELIYPRSDSSVVHILSSPRHERPWLCFQPACAR